MNLGPVALTSRRSEVTLRGDLKLRSTNFSATRATHKKEQETQKMLEWVHNKYFL